MFNLNDQKFRDIPLVLVIIAFSVSMTGCDLLEVDNPNSLVESDLDNPASASALANGAEATITEGLGIALGPYSAATDELTWVGTLDAWQQLDQGEVDDPQNQFIDEAFNQLSEARWTADDAIRRLKKFKDEGKLQNQKALIRAYFYGAVAYTSIADLFDNFVISEKGESAPPQGASNMRAFYQTALDYIEKGRALTGSSATKQWEDRLLALKARVLYAQQLWTKLNPSVEAQNPLVASQRAADVAREALSRTGAQNEWEYDLEVTTRTQDNDMAYSVNQRLELRFGDTYIEATSDNKVDSVVLQDPIDNITSPHLVDEINQFSEAEQYADIPLLSNRELHLIIAEHALAQADSSTFEQHINTVRNYDGLSDYDGQISALEILKHERQVSLFLQGRRLADLYRFGEASPEWVSSRVDPGTFFPITITEIRSNPNVDLE